MSPKTAILILHFKDSPHTLACLDSLQPANSHSPFNTYVLAIQSHSAESLSAHPLKPVVLKDERNLGFAWANNILIKKALHDGCDNLVLLNNDTVVDESFLPPLVKQLNLAPVGMVCPKIYFFKNSEYHHDEYSEEERGHVIWFAGGVIDWKNMIGFHQGVNEVDHGQWNKKLEIDFATGCCVGITRQTIEKIGLMNEKYFLYYEDADWSMQAKHHGLAIILEPKSIIWHKNAGSTRGPGSPIHQYYQTRNRIYFGLKYAPLRTKIHLTLNALNDLRSPHSLLSQANRDGLFLRMGKNENDSLN